MSWIPSARFVSAYNVFQSYWSQPGAVSALVKKSEIYLESAKTDNLPSREDLILYSFKAFKCFKNVWDFDGFWKRANTCDACISLAAALIAQKPNDPEVNEVLQTLQEMLEQNLAYYNTVDRGDMWGDDFGWCGLMALNASNLLKKVGNETLATKYFNLSYDCWNYMIKHSYDNSLDAKPVAHGCQNNTVNIPTDGVKNTVVNALLMLLSTRLYRFSGQADQPIVDRKPFLDMACKQWLWFSKWFEYKDKDNVYLKSSKNNAALVGERPLAVDSDYQNISHPNWSAGWVWTGDQGLLIGGLLDLLTLKDNLSEYLNPNFDVEIKEILQRLVKGVQEAVIGNGDGLFHEPPCLSSYTSYGSEYLGGRGVLVRYMGVYEIKNLLGVDLTPNILQTTKAIWSTRDNNSNQFKPEFATDPQSQEYFTQFKNLLGYSDDITGWSIDPTDKLVSAVSQAVGLDFLGIALSTYGI
jgi:Glycosyl hydrolase family 76